MPASSLSHSTLGRPQAGVELIVLLAQPVHVALSVCCTLLLLTVHVSHAQAR